MNNEGINVLSLFDGMSCGQIALNLEEIKIKNYYASEIKPHGIKVTQHNFPNTIQLGDVTQLKAEMLPKIDLLIGGSPCQGFSIAGKQLNFDDPRSKLFFEYVRLLNEVKPKYFLLENVNMKKDWQDVISSYLNVEPIYINSKLVSAQMRSRLYWTNIPNVKLPDDKKINLQSILESGFTTKEKAYCILEGESRPHSTNWKRFRRWRKKGFVNIVFEDESLNIFRNRFLSQLELERLQTVPEGYTSILDRNEAASLLGDGWTVDVIRHILKNIKNE